MKNAALGDFIGKHVKLWQGGSENYYYTEEGVLEAYDHPWISLTFPDGERVCIPVYTVRLIRLSRVSQAAEESETLREAA